MASSRRWLQFSLRGFFGSVVVVALASLLVAKIVSGKTIYSSGYSEFGWFRVQCGMNDADVLQLLGPPLAKWSNTTGETWAYARQKRYWDDHFVRDIEFKDGAVFKKISHFRFD